MDMVLVYGRSLKKGVGSFGGNRISFLVEMLNVKFCKEKWHGDESRCVFFPSLLVLANSKEVCRWQRFGTLKAHGLDMLLASC